MCIDDFKLLAKKIFLSELETMKQAIRIYSQEIRVEFSIRKHVIPIIKSGKENQ